MSVAAAGIVAGAGAAAAVAAAIVRTHKDNDNQKDYPAVVAEKVHRLPSLRALNSYYAKGGGVCKKNGAMTKILPQPLSFGKKSVALQFPWFCADKHIAHNLCALIGC